MDLFDHAAEKDPALVPLAERMRPRTLDEVLGQDHLLAPGAVLRLAIEADRVPSMVLWGPPGVGKTTIARLIARHTKSEFEQLSAVLAGVKDIREVVERARKTRSMYRRRTVLFVDEIHRFNRSQQDALLPHVEQGTLVLVGATTENPSFEVNAALLSRARVFVLRALDADTLLPLLRRAMVEARGLAAERLEADDDALAFLARHADGDARRALVGLEIAASNASTRRGRPDGVARVTLHDAEEAMQQRSLLYDKGGEEHFNLASAFIKSMRGSDPDAAVYYLVRMLESGEPPRFLLRRMVIFASEDIGNADPRALSVALDAQRAFEFVGLPEATLPLTQAVTYLAMAPKSNTALTTYAAARKDVVDRGALPVPMNIRNAPTRLMSSLGYGSGYKYPHDFEGHYTPDEYLPDALKGRRYYHPSENGEEAGHARRLEEILQARGVVSDDGD